MKKFTNEEDLQLEPSLSFLQHTEVIQVHRNKVFLDDVILDARYYREVIHMLQEMTENDSCEFYVDSPGGNADGMLALINAVENCQGQVICFIEGECASAASLFSLACPNVVVGKRARMLCHSARFSLPGGKHADQRSHFQFNDKLLTSIIEEFYEGFLSPEEIQDVLNGKEHYLMAEEIEERLAARELYFTAKSEEESKPEPAPAKKDPKPKKVKAVKPEAENNNVVVKVAPDYYPL